MHEWRSLSHVRWECKDHALMIPTYRRDVSSGRRWRRSGVIPRDPGPRRGVAIPRPAAVVGDFVRLTCDRPDARVTAAHVPGTTAVRTATTRPFSRPLCTVAQVNSAVT
jgi:hypothetical protein